MRSTIALLCIALAACSDATSDVDLSVNPPEITDPPADTAEPDTTLRDTAVTPDAPTPLCANDRDCNTECVLGRCASGRCIFEGADPLAQGCVMDPDALTCLAPGAPDPARPTCFFCNPSADIGAFVSRAFAEDFECGLAVPGRQQLVTLVLQKEAHEAQITENLEETSARGYAPRDRIFFKENQRQQKEEMPVSLGGTPAPLCAK